MGLIPTFHYVNIGLSTKTYEVMVSFVKKNAWQLDNLPSAKITEVNISAFVYRLFHEDFSPRFR